MGIVDLVERSVQPRGVPVGEGDGKNGSHGRDGGNRQKDIKDLWVEKGGIFGCGEPCGLLEMWCVLTGGCNLPRIQWCVKRYYM